MLHRPGSPASRWRERVVLCLGVRGRWPRRDAGGCAHRRELKAGRDASLSDSEGGCPSDPDPNPAPPPTGEPCSNGSWAFWTWTPRRELAVRSCAGAMLATARPCFAWHWPMVQAASAFGQLQPGPPPAVLLSFSDVALRRRLRGAADGLGQIAGALLSARLPSENAVRTERLRIVDGSSISHAGCRRDQLTAARGIRSRTSCFTDLELTGADGGEGFGRFSFSRGDLVHRSKRSEQLRCFKGALSY